jgi:hypothetical protein
MRMFYKYPHAGFSYARLLQENRKRDKQQPEFELAHTGIFDERRYFDVVADYAKATAKDLLVSITITNLGPEPAQRCVASNGDRLS